MIWENSLPYFSADELRCKCGCGLLRLDIRFASMLSALREEWNHPMTLTSACRCPQHNKNVGGHPNSLHLTKNPVHLTYGTMACDVAWLSWSKLKKLRFAQLAYSLGWRVGLHEHFCHVDRGAALRLPRIVFVYGAWANEFTIADVESLSEL